MRCLIYQTANDRLHNVGVGITAFLWREPETETGLAQGAGGMLRAYVDDKDERRRLVLRWGFAPAWVGHEGLLMLGKDPWPCVATERAASSRIFAHPLRYQRCLIPADALYVAEVKGAWLKGPEQSTVFLAGIWDEGTFALLTAEAPTEWRNSVGPRMPVALSSNHFDRWLSPEVTCLRDVQEVLTARRADWTLAEARPATAAYSSYPGRSIRRDAEAPAASPAPAFEGDDFSDIDFTAP